MRVELRTEAEGLALQVEVDEFHGLPRLSLGRTVRELIGVELQRDAMNGDDFQVESGLTKANAASL